MHNKWKEFRCVWRYLEGRSDSDTDLGPVTAALLRLEQREARYRWEQHVTHGTRDGKHGDNKVQASRHLHGRFLLFILQTGCTFLLEENGMVPKRLLSE